MPHKQFLGFTNELDKNISDRYENPNYISPKYLNSKLGSR